MISLKDFILEELILEADSEVWVRPSGEVNAKVLAIGHPLERVIERSSTATQIRNAVVQQVNKSFKKCWSRLKEMVDNGKLVKNAPDSGKSGSSIIVRCPYNDTLGGKLAFPIYFVSHSNESDVYKFNVKTVYIENEKNGKLKTHTEYGQLEIYADKGEGKDITELTNTKKPPTKSKTPSQAMPKVVGKIDLSRIPKR